MPIIRLSLSCLLCSLLLYTSGPGAEPRTYIMGVVPQFESRRINQIWQPIINTISSATGIALQLKTSPSIPEFEQQFSTGEFDFAYMNPYHLVMANKKQGYLPILRDTDRNLSGIIVVRQDSPIETASELHGKTIAFPAPNALGAALLPRAELSGSLEIEFREMYVNTHTSVYLNVVLRQADAGGGVVKTLSKQPDAIKNQLRVLHQTASVPSHPIAAHPRVPEESLNKITSAFLNFDKTAEGKALLDKIPLKKIGKTSLDDYQRLDNMGLEKYYIENK